MTRTEVIEGIEAETHTATWRMASLETRLMVIGNFVDELTGESLNEVPKQIKKRKPRKPKAAQLTQHATAQEDE